MPEYEEAERCRYDVVNDQNYPEPEYEPTKGEQQTGDNVEHVHPHYLKI